MNFFANSDITNKAIQHYLRLFVIILTGQRIGKQNGSKYGYKAENNEYPLHFRLIFQYSLRAMASEYTEK